MISTIPIAGSILPGNYQATSKTPLWSSLLMVMLALGRCSSSQTPCADIDFEPTMNCPIDNSHLETIAQVPSKFNDGSKYLKIYARCADQGRHLWVHDCRTGMQNPTYAEVLEIKQIESINIDTMAR